MASMKSNIFSLIKVYLQGEYAHGEYTSYHGAWSSSKGTTRSNQRAARWQSLKRP